MKNYILQLFCIMLLAVGCGSSTPVSPTEPGNGNGTGVEGAHGPAPINLESSENFVILAKTGVTNVPTSSITGNIGISPAAASFITGFSLNLDPGSSFATSSQVTGQIFAPGYASPTPVNLTTAIGDMETAYENAAGATNPDHTELASGSIGGMTLPAGLYKWSNTVNITSDLTINGGANDTWIFQIAGGLTLASGKKIILAGGAKAKNIVWQVAQVVTVETTAHMEGIVLGKTGIVLKTNASANGRLLGQTAVTLEKNTVVEPD